MVNKAVTSNNWTENSTFDVVPEKVLISQVWQPYIKVTGLTCVANCDVDHTELVEKMFRTLFSKSFQEKCWGFHWECCCHQLMLDVLCNICHTKAKIWVFWLCHKLGVLWWKNQCSICGCGGQKLPLLSQFHQIKKSLFFTVAVATETKDILQPTVYKIHNEH